VTCSDGRVSPPTCDCDPQYYSLISSTSENCISIVCSAKCETCSTSADNCLTCSNGRENPPKCLCSGECYESNYICYACGTG